MRNELGLRLNIFPAISRRSSLNRLSDWFAPAHQNTLLAQLPDVVELLAACLRGGLPLTDSLEWVAKRSSGIIAVQLEQILQSRAAGDSSTTALLNFEAKQADPHLREFAIKLALSEQLGSPVAGQLVALAESLRVSRLSQLREIGAKKETRMMMPLVFLVLPITVLFAVFPSLQFLQFQAI